MARSLRFSAPVLALAAAAGLALAGCSLLPTGNQEEDSEAPLVEEPVCADPSLVPARLAALRQSDADLLAAIAGNRIKPEDAAARALAKADFRLAGATVEAPDIARPYGVECRVPGGFDSRSLRVLGFVGSSGGNTAKAAALADFGRRYNAVLLADPDYPYADVCRADPRSPGTLADDDPDASMPADQVYGFSGEGFNPRPIDLGEAVRRGAASRVARMLRDDPEVINAPDAFGMTPLGWAVAYRRSDAVDLLLAARASPAGPACQSVLDSRAPMQVARAMQWRGMVQRLLPLVPLGDRDLLEQKTAADPASLVDFNKVLLELNARYRDDLQTDLPGSDRHQLMLEIDADGTTTECHIEPATPAPRFDAELCADAKLILKWAPARNIYGKPVKGETNINLVGVGK